MLALAYIRWSSMDQTRGDSERRQTELARTLCQQQGWQLNEVIIERGKSAYHGRNRAEGGELAKLEKRAASGALAGQVLIVENLDRLSRQEPLESLNLLQSLTLHGLTVAESSTGQIYDTANIRANWQNLLVAFIRAGLAFEESEKKAKRLKAAHEGTRLRGHRRTDGKVDLRFAPGWIERSADGLDFVINETHANVIRKIYEDCANGKGLRHIVKELNADPANYAWKRGPFNVANLSKLIRGRAALGEFQSVKQLPNGTKVGSGIWSPLFPAIITTQQWHRAQAALQSRAGSGGSKRHEAVNALQGLVRCHATKADGTLCNALMNTYRPKGCKRRLRCSSYSNGGDCTSGRTVYYELLLEAVLDNVLHLALPDKQESNTSYAAIAAMEGEVEEAQRRLDNLVDAFAANPSDAQRRGLERAEQGLEQRKLDLDALKLAYSADQAKRPATSIMQEVAELRSQLATSAEARLRVNAALKEVVTGMWFKPANDEVHVLVAGVHALRFTRQGEHLQTAVATSAMLDGAYVDNPLAMERYKQRA